MRLPACPLMLGCTLLSAAAFAGCSTNELYPDVMEVQQGTMTPGIGVIRDDTLSPYLEDQNQNQNLNLSLYRVMVDGRFAAWGGRDYVRVFPEGGGIGFALPAGQHVFGLADQDGQVVATSPPVETQAQDPATPGFKPAVIFFGGPTSLRTRVLVNDPTAVPLGSWRVRVMNALVDHQPIQVVQCPTDLEPITFGTGPPTTTASSCTPVAGPIAYGDVFEAEVGDDVVRKLGVHWAAPDVADPVVWTFARADLTRELFPDGHYTFIPTQVWGPAWDSCPSCIWRTNFGPY